MIKDNKWEINSSLIIEAIKGNRKYKKVLSYENKDQIFKNIYRVLLTRGRNGLIICIPNYRSLDGTYEFF
ncbi:protein of unknown function [Tepidibacter aestuarii]|nr:protein of unknown function [Tepidibacter aestuarii]